METCSSKNQQNNWVSISSGSHLGLLLSKGGKFFLRISQTRLVTARNCFKQIFPPKQTHTHTNRKLPTRQLAIKLNRLDVLPASSSWGQICCCCCWCCAVFFCPSIEKWHKIWGFMQTQRARWKSTSFAIENGNQMDGFFLSPPQHPSDKCGKGYDGEKRGSKYGKYCWKQAIDLWYTIVGVTLEGFSVVLLRTKKREICFPGKVFPATINCTPSLVLCNLGGLFWEEILKKYCFLMDWKTVEKKFG